MIDAARNSTTSSAPGIVFWSKSIATAAVLALAAHLAGLLHSLSSDHLRQAGGVVASVAATLLGFVLAALAILLTVANTRLLRNMMRTGHFGVLLSRMYGCMVACGVATAAGLAVSLSPRLDGWLAYLLLFCLLLCSIVMSDMLRKFRQVLTHLRPE